jgi:hypothetical protein
MVALANRLGARVQGDEGEVYDGTESLDDYHAAAGRRSDTAAVRERRPWWRRLLGE